MTCKTGDGTKALHLNSYVVKKKSGKKNILVLNTTNVAHYCTDDDKEKPLTYKVYDYTKGGVDIPDQHMGSYTTKSKTRKWTLVAHAYILDIVRVNAQTIATANGATVKSSFEFAWELVLALAKPHMQSRLAIGGLQMRLTASIKAYLKDDVEARRRVAQNDEPQPARARCGTCLDEMERGPQYKIRKSNMKKHSSRYRSCSNAVCDNHKATYCNRGAEDH